MADQVDAMRDRHEDSERRRKMEASGYQSDVKLLQQKIKQVEMQMVKAAVGKSKEHEYIKIIKAYEKEVEQLKATLKKNPRWID